MPKATQFKSKEDYNKWFRDYREKNREHFRKYYREYNKKWRKKNKSYLRQLEKYKRAHPLENKAQRILRYAVRKKWIIKKPCDKCGKINNIVGHHSDYSKPLEVIWLCKIHHRMTHYGGVDNLVA